MLLPSFLSLRRVGMVCRVGESNAVTTTGVNAGCGPISTTREQPASMIFSMLALSLLNCLICSVSLFFSSGSAASSSVENSLIVSQYDLKFFTPTQSQEGDGRVPTFIDNAFSGSLGFSNAPDCQPLLNLQLNLQTDRTICLPEWQFQSHFFVVFRCSTYCQ